MENTLILLVDTSSSRTCSGIAWSIIVDMRRSNRCHFSCVKEGGVPCPCWRRSRGDIFIWDWYQPSASLRRVFHHVSAVAVKSETTGSMSSSQSLNWSGDWFDDQAGKGGNSWAPDRTTSIPLIDPPSSRSSWYLRCSSFIFSIIRHINSSDFSVNPAAPVSADGRSPPGCCASPDIPSGGLAASFGTLIGGLAASFRTLSGGLAASFRTLSGGLAASFWTLSGGLSASFRTLSGGLAASFEPSLPFGVEKDKSTSGTANPVSNAWILCFNSSFWPINSFMYALMVDISWDSADILASSASKNEGLLKAGKKDRAGWSPYNHGVLLCSMTMSLTCSSVNKGVCMTSGVADPWFGTPAEFWSGVISSTFLFMSTTPGVIAIAVRPAEDFSLRSFWGFALLGWAAREDADSLRSFWGFALLGWAAREDADPGSAGVMAAGEVRGGKGTGLTFLISFFCWETFWGTFQLHLLYFLYLSITLNIF